MSKYQIWYERKWPLSMPSKNKENILRYARRLRAAYGDTDKTIIRVRRVDS